MNSTPFPRLIVAALIAALLSLASATAGNPHMERAYELLKGAKEQLQPGLGTKADPLPMVQAARDHLKKAPSNGRYRGHRAAAIEEAEKAIVELKTGDRARKALEHVEKSIVQINAGGGLHRGNREPRPHSASPLCDAP